MANAIVTPSVLENEWTQADRRALKRLEIELRDVLADLPSEQREILRARAAGRPLAAIAEVMGMSAARAVSLHAEATDFVQRRLFGRPTAPPVSEAPELDLVPSGEPPVEDVALASLEAQRVRREVRSLPAVEAKVIGLRYGLDGPEHSVRQTAARLGMTHSTVHRVERRALEVLRGVMSDCADEVAA